MTCPSLGHAHTRTHTHRDTHLEQASVMQVTGAACQLVMNGTGAQRFPLVYIYVCMYVRVHVHMCACVRKTDSLTQPK